MSKIVPGSRVKIIDPKSDFCGEKGVVETVFDDEMLMIKLDTTYFGITAFTFETGVEVTK